MATDTTFDAGGLPDWPMFGLEDDVRPALMTAQAAGQAAALVTLHRIVGSAPRPPGAQMLITASGLTGFLSGGCVEADIAIHAHAALADGKPRRLIYGEGGPFPDIQLLCGARIELLIEPLSPADPAARRLIELWQARRPAVWLSDGENRACFAAGETPPSIPASLDAALSALTARLGVACVSAGDPSALAVRFKPQSRIVVVGGDPTALALCRLAAEMGFETWLLRPKGPQAPPPLSGVHYRRGPAPEAMAEIGLDPWTFVAVATHDLEIDEDALAFALESPAPYVGVLGARRRLPERLAGLRLRGVGDPALARLRAPIGLDLGEAKAPYEIAVAIMAEVVALARSSAV
ncbi:MAG: XdhC family protein [Caulobacteraceae bacterium]